MGCGNHGSPSPNRKTDIVLQSSVATKRIIKIYRILKDQY